MQEHENQKDVAKEVSQRKEEVVCECEKLAALTGVEDGIVRITISEAKVVKIKVRQEAQICCLQRKANRWTSWTGNGLDLSESADFVTAKLESPIVSLVGPFGYLEAVVDKGSVSELMLDTSLRRRRRKKSRARTTLCR